MAKLSSAQDTAIRGLINGGFPKGTRRSTIDVLLAGDYVVFYSDSGSYDYGKAGREYLGTAAAQTINASVEEVLSELDTNPWNAAQFADHGDVAEDPNEYISLTKGWTANRGVWDNNGVLLSNDEIKADIATARVVPNRRARRAARKNSHNH